jgi:hypothetical protein
MDAKKILGSKEYRDARAKIALWRARLSKADAKEAAGIRAEKSEYFSKMRKDNPGIYYAFQLDDKTLSETIFEKLTGKKISVG